MQSQVHLAPGRMLRTGSPWDSFLTPDWFIKHSVETSTEGSRKGHLDELFEGWASNLGDPLFTPKATCSKQQGIGIQYQILSFQVTERFCRT